MAKRFPKHLPVNWVRQGQPGGGKIGVDPKAKGDPYRPDDDYHPTAIIVACTGCKTVGTVDFPRGFDARIGDKLMDGRVVRGYCDGCRQMCEFRPITPKELKDNALLIFRRYHDIYKKLVIQHEGKIVPVSDELDAVLNDTAALMEDVKKKTGSEEAPTSSGLIVPGQAKPPDKDDDWENRKPQIVVP